MRTHKSAENQYIQLDTKNCKACWKCVEKCPKKVIGKVNIFIHKHARIVNSKECIGCLKCVKICEQGAIKTLING